MKRSWNGLVWLGALVVLVGVVSYPVFFVRFPSLRDFPSANLAILAIGLALLGVGVARAFKQPARYRGKIFGSVLGVLALGLAAVFCYGIFVGSKHVLPVAVGAPQVGQMAPDFTLEDSRNQPVRLYGLLESAFLPNGAPRSTAGADRTAGVVLIFYRGYW